MKKKTLYDIAVLLQSGFERIDEMLSNLESSLTKKIDRLVEQNNELKQGLDEVKIKLDYKADKFEVDELKKRVTRTERRLRLPLE